MIKIQPIPILYYILFLKRCIYTIYTYIVHRGSLITHLNRKNSKPRFTCTKYRIRT